MMVALATYTYGTVQAVLHCEVELRGLQLGENRWL